MNLQLHGTPAAQPSSRLAIADCDIHPALRKAGDLDPWLPARWRAHLASFGGGRRIGMEAGPAYPKS